MMGRSCRSVLAQGSESGLLGVYPDCLHGRAAVSGDRYDTGTLSAAHESLRLGSFARVANFNTGLMMDLGTNDRKGRDDRMVGLSRAAPQRIGVSPNGASPESLLVIMGIKGSAQEAALPYTRAMSAS